MSQAKLKDKSQQLQLLGLLTAGVAHELNTPVAFVASNLTSLTDYLHDIETAQSPQQRQALLCESHELLQECVDGVKRIQDIIVAISSFNKHQAAPLICLAHTPMQMALQLTWHQLKYQVEVKQMFHAEQRILVQQGRLVQVLVNLIINAIYAMKDQPQQSLHLETYDLPGQVELLVADNGPGIAPSIASHIFDYFFTTKNQDGTGLGLALAKEFIEQQGGSIQLTEHELGGAAFRILLPIAEATP